MTCIVGVTDGKNIWMGGDSCAGNGSYVLSLKTPKVVKRKAGKADILFGVTGDTRGMWLIQSMDVPDYHGDVMEYVFSKLVTAMRSHFKENGYLRISDSKEDQDCHYLVGIDGRIFSIWDGFGVIESSDNYWALGSGMYLALGSLHATNSMDIEPRKRVEMALEAAAYHTPYVDLPIHIENI